MSARVGRLGVRLGHLLHKGNEILSQHRSEVFIHIIHDCLWGPRRQSARVYVRVRTSGDKWLSRSPLAQLLEELRANWAAAF